VSCVILAHVANVFDRGHHDTRLSITEGSAQ